MAILLRDSSVMAYISPFSTFKYGQQMWPEVPGEMNVIYSLKLGYSGISVSLHCSQH
jgi:hypothetical protein